MSNKENLWRLQNSEGEPAAEKPKSKWSGIGNVLMKIKMADGTYKEIGEMQSINFTREVQPIYELGSAMPVHHMTGQTTVQVIGEETISYNAINTERLREQIIRMSNASPFIGNVEIQHETIEQTIPDIGSRMAREIHRYQERFVDRPRYVSLDKDAYRSLWLAMRNNRYGVVTDGDTFMGIPIVCNPTQEYPIMALGSPIQEGIEGRLYNE